MNKMTFTEAKEFVKDLGLKTFKDWQAWKHNRPSNMPAVPTDSYKCTGEWRGWKDFLGNYDEFMKFEEAREFIRSLKFKSYNEWIEYSKLNNSPKSLPKYPAYVYREDWKGWKDFLNYKDNYLSYEEAKTIVCNLKLAGARDFWKLKNKPLGIPSSPSSYYLNKGWIDWPDFLGKNISNPDIDEKCIIIDNLKVYPKNGIVENSLTKRTILNRKSTPEGYMVTPWRNGSTFVHRVIYMVANKLTSLPKNIQIDHIDNDRSNNKIENLQALTQRTHNIKTVVNHYFLKLFTIKDIIFYDSKDKQHFIVEDIEFEDIND